MINHIWSVLCLSSSVDKETNNISLFNVLERLDIMVNQSKQTETTNQKELNIGINYQIVSMWTKDTNTDKDLESQIQITDDKGKLIKTFDQKVVFPESSKRLRTIINISGMTINADSNNYSFNLMIKQKDNKYRLVASIPLEIRMVKNKDGGIV